MERKELLVFAIVTLITVVAWVGFDLYFHRTKTEISNDLKEVIEPINPNFDLSAFQ
jgi:hypothetical protein